MDVGRLGRVIAAQVHLLGFGHKQNIESVGWVMADSSRGPGRGATEEEDQAVEEGNSADKAGLEADCSLIDFQEIVFVRAGMKDWVVGRIVVEVLVGIDLVVHSSGQGS